MSFRYRTVWISDVHLGAPACRAEELERFLAAVRCRTLYLVGDIVDLLRLRRRWHWPPSHDAVLRRLLALPAAGTRVVFVPGNHDAGARAYVGMALGGAEVAERCIHETADSRRLLVTHGDQFDRTFTHTGLTRAGDLGYALLLALDPFDRLLRRLGKPQRSLATQRSLTTRIKMRFKTVCNFVGRFEAALVAEARAARADGVVCGHIHHAAARPDEVAYYNCGDWLESCTALVEHDDGRITLVDAAAAGVPVPVQPREDLRPLAA